MNSVKVASPDHPIADGIAHRWSPRSFADTPVSEETLLRLLEAARWAPSCFNEQPWHFIVARKEHEEHYNRVLHALLPKNQRWAYTAPVLMISIARTTFAQSGKPNRHALHDVGLAMGNLIQQATAEELYVHQMAGIDRDAARHEFSIPENHEVVAGVAVGYLGDPDKLSDEFRDKEKEGRRRQPLSDFVYGTAFGVKSELVSG